MALNKLMHPRNMYRSKPDFQELAAAYPDFRKHVLQNSFGHISINFEDPEALRALTRSLLERDFDLKIEIPPDRLIPTVPLRLNYILWIEDLLDTLPREREAKTITGLDIGTGATCVYPLLGSRKNGWNFLASDVDLPAVECARRNVNANNLDDRVQVVLSDPEDGPLRVARDFERSIDFSMCNPPFFSSDTHAHPRNRARITSKHYLEQEGCTSGGELQFVSEMVRDSCTLTDKIKIYTSMLGKKQSFRAVKRMLSKIGEIKDVATTHFCQGQQMRWGIAWTFASGVTFSGVPRPIRKRKAKKEPESLGFVIPRHYSFPLCLQSIKSALVTLQFSLEDVVAGENIARMTGKAMVNRWSHQRRRRREESRRAAFNGEDGTIKPLPQSSSEAFDTDKNSALLSDHDEEAIKRIKFEQDGAKIAIPSVTTAVGVPRATNSSAAAISVLLNLWQRGDNVVLELRWLDGTLGPDAAYQLLQYLKNRFT